MPIPCLPDACLLPLKNTYMLVNRTCRHLHLVNCTLGYFCVNCQPVKTLYQSKGEVLCVDMSDDHQLPFSICCILIVYISISVLCFRTYQYYLDFQQFLVLLMNECYLGDHKRYSERSFVQNLEKTPAKNIFYIKIYEETL